MIRVCAVLALVSGCAVTLDGFYKLAGPHARSSTSGPSLATGQVDGWREIEVDRLRGLVCRDVTVPTVRRATVTTRVTNPNGYKAATQFFTVVEWLVAGLIVGVHEHTCATTGCDDPGSFYPYLAPLAADILWGTYRSFTIHDAILRSAEIGWGGPIAGEQTTEREPCAAGTELVLQGGPDQVIVHVGEGGFTGPAELALIAEFIGGHASFAVSGEHVRLDASRASELVASMRVRAPTAQPGTPTVVVPALPPGVTIDVNVKVAPRKRSR
jgi:hypothetical protein